MKIGCDKKKLFQIDTYPNTRLLYIRAQNRYRIEYVEEIVIFISKLKRPVHI